MLEEIRRGIHDTSEEELIFILGDFNAQLGIIGDQDVNYNGRIVLNMMTEDNMILLNDTEKCKEIYTWGRGEPKCAIDFILVNTLAYKFCQEMNIDEKQEKFHLSDHNLIEISLKLNDTNYQRRGKWEEKQYYRLDDESLDKYIVQLELDLETTNDITIK